MSKSKTTTVTKVSTKIDVSKSNTSIRMEYKGSVPRMENPPPPPPITKINQKK
jgi:hypothetical protein